jgi:hypothetical protein
LPPGKRVHRHARGGDLEGRPSDGLDPADGEEVAHALEPVDAGPAADAGIENNSVEARDTDAIIITFEGEGPAEELRGGPVDGVEVAQVELQGEEVDAGGGVGGVDGAPGPEAGRGGGLVQVAAQQGGGLGRLAGVAGGGDEDQVRGQGAGGEELVDEALADAQSDAAASVWSEYLCILKRVGTGWYLFAPVTRAKKVSLAGTWAQGAAAIGQAFLEQSSSDAVKVDSVT